MIKLFVSSFYNTLIDKEEAIPMSTMLKIDEMHSKGIGFCILTNRLIEDVLYYNNDYPFIDYIIGLNGSLIYDVKKKKIVYKTPLSNDLIDDLDLEDVTYYSKNNYYKELKKEDIYKIEIKNSKDKVNKLSQLNIPYTIFKDDKSSYLEINSTSPYKGLKQLLKIINVKESEVLCVVGNLSEKSIVTNFKNTCVVSNSPKELKEITNHKTKSNNAKGVEQVIDLVL